VSTIIVRGHPVSISHLAPFTFTCPCLDPSVSRPLRIRASFSNHCYTSSFDKGVHDRGDILLREPNRVARVFDAVRNQLSLQLPEIIGALPDAKVNQTPERRNFIFTKMVDVDMPGTDWPEGVRTSAPKVRYEVFFSLGRPDVKTPAHDLRLVVESAYPAYENRTVLPRRPSAIRFSMLATKVFLRQPLKFAAR
jgi:hypothetical protein